MTQTIEIAGRRIGAGLEPYVICELSGNHNGSLEPDGFAGLVRDCKAACRALGAATYDELGSERAAAGHRRSLYVARNVAAGEALKADNVRSVRPGYGLPPGCLAEVLGARATRDLSFGEPLDWSKVERDAGR